MSTNLQDYVELLNAEQHVQVDKLKDHARHGIADRVRGEVWMYLLNVLSEDKTNEITTVMALSSSYALLPASVPSHLSALLLKTALQHHTHRFFNPTYAGLISSITAEQDGTSAQGSGGVTGAYKAPPIASTTSNPAKVSSQSSNPNLSIPPTTTKSSTSSSTSPTLPGPEEMTLRTQYGRFLPSPPTSPPTRQTYLATLEEVLGKFYHAESDQGRDGEYRRRVTELEQGQKDWVWLVTPFMCCLTRPAAVFLGFQKLMERMNSFPPISSRLAMFLTLFKMAMPELFLYFEDEQVRYVDIGLSWVRTLFAREMWLGNVLRLWDAYLAADDMFELHCYVCVAVLATCKETLEELDGSEIKLMLLDLPPFDIDRLLQDAGNLRVTFPLPRPIDDTA